MFILPLVLQYQLTQLLTVCLGPALHYQLGASGACCKYLIPQFFQLMKGARIFTAPVVHRLHGILYRPGIDITH